MSHTPLNDLSPEVRRKLRQQKHQTNKNNRWNILYSDSLRSANLSSVEVDWAVRLIRALKERHL